MWKLFSFAGFVWLVCQCSCNRSTFFRFEFGLLRAQQCCFSPYKRRAEKGWPWHILQSWCTMPDMILMSQACSKCSACGRRFATFKHWFLTDYNWKTAVFIVQIPPVGPIMLLPLSSVHAHTASVVTTHQQLTLPDISAVASYIIASPSSAPFYTLTENCICPFLRLWQNQQSCNSG